MCVYNPKMNCNNCNTATLQQKLKFPYPEKHETMLYNI